MNHKYSLKSFTKKLRDHGLTYSVSIFHTSNGKHYRLLNALPGMPLSSFLPPDEFDELINGIISGKYVLGENYSFISIS